MAPRCRKKARKRGTLSLGDKVDIVHQVLVEHEMVADVAKEYRVSQQVVQILVTKARKKKGFFEELLAIKDVKAIRRQVISEVVAGLVKDDAFIDSVASVVEAVEE